MIVQKDFPRKAGVHRAKIPAMSILPGEIEKSPFGTCVPLGDFSRYYYITFVHWNSIGFHGCFEIPLMRNRAIQLCTDMCSSFQLQRLQAF